MFETAQSLRPTDRYCRWCGNRISSVETAAWLFDKGKNLRTNGEPYSSSPEPKYVEGIVFGGFRSTRFQFITKVQYRHKAPRLHVSPPDANPC